MEERSKAYLDSYLNSLPTEVVVAEGEGDKTLAWWREAHWNFFSRESKELKITPNEDMILVLERFKVVHQ